MNTQNSNLAVLIDGDNIPSAHVTEMMEEIAKYGNPTIKRIYGDWTSPHLSKWKIHYETKDHKIADAQTHATKWLFHFADGKNSIDQIAKISKIKPDLIYKISLIMKKSKLLMFKNYEYKQSR